MSDTESKLPLVDRERELEELKNKLDSATHGNGNLLFISGEVGVGKSRLLSELIEYARSQHVQVMQGWSLYETLTPYMPLIDALRSAEMDYLFSQEEPPKVDCVYLMDDNGLLINKIEREESKLDSEIFSGMLTAVSQFAKESLSLLSGEEREEGMLNSLGYQNYRILVESGKNVNLVAVLTGRENEFLINDMRKILMEVEKDFGDMFKDWDGDRAKVSGVNEHLRILITSGKYDGIDYAKEDPQIKRNRLFDNILLGMVRHTNLNPSLLCIEDLQWADPSTMALLHYIARKTRNCNLLILGTYRPEDVTATKDGKVHFLIESLQLMSREGLYKKIELGRLEETYIDEMLNSVLGKADFSDDFKNHLYKETEGNPFFIVELIRMMVEEEAIERKDDVWTLAKDLKEANIPTKVNDVIVRRLNRLQEGERKILDYASVIGEEFTSTVLADAMGVSRVELLEQLRTLEKKHTLIHSLGAKYKFDHAKIKEVLYSEIPVELRMEYHLIIANRIEEQNKDKLDNVIEDLAFHYYHCRDKEKAISYLIKAAESAKADYSNKWALRFYNQALELEKNEQNRMVIFETLGDVNDLIGNYDRSIDSYEKALGLTKETKKKAEIKAKIGSMYEKKGDYIESVKACTEALDLVGDEGSKEEALALQNLGYAYLRQGEFERAIERLEKGLRIWEKLGDEWGIGVCLGKLGNVHFRSGEPESALEYHDKSLKIRKKIGDERGVAASLNATGNVYWARGEYDKALNYCHESLEIYEKIGDRWGVAACLNNIGMMHATRGKYDGAFEHFKKGLEIFESMGDQDDIALSYHNIGDTHRLMGEHDKALEHLQKSLKITEKIGFQSLTADNYWIMAQTYFDKTDLEEAADCCNRAFDLSKELGEKRVIAGSKRVFGMIYREQENWDESMKNFEESLRIFKEIGMEKELGDSYYEYGLMWKAKGDEEKARAYFTDSLGIYENLKLEKHVEKARKILG
jgi:predicted ATPase